MVFVRRASLAFVSLLLVLSAPVMAGRKPTAMLLSAGGSDCRGALIKALTAELGRAGYEVQACSLSEWQTSDPKTRVDLLVLPDGSLLPPGAVDVILQTLKGGTDLIALKVPLASASLIEMDGRWMTREECQLQTAGTLAPHVAYSFTEDGFKTWQRVSSDTAREITLRQVADQPREGEHALHVFMPHMRGWELQASPERQDVFPTGHALTVFSARGSANTTQLSVEWMEKDGSRWIGVVGLSPQWKRYVLAPEDFKFWVSVPQRSRTTFNPANAVALKLGLGSSHTGYVTGPHEYWVGSIGTAPRCESLEQLRNEQSLARVDLLCPDDKFFDCSGSLQLTVRDDQCIVDAVSLPSAGHVRSPHPRPRGCGFDKGRDWRWIPLIEARGDDRAYRGTPAVMKIHADGPFKGGLWAVFSVQDDAWYLSPAVLRVIRQIAGRMQLGPFLLEGGTNYFTYFTDQQVHLGARIVNQMSAMNVAGRAVITARDSQGRTINRREWPVSCPAGRTETVEETISVREWVRDGAQCRTELYVDDQLIDYVEHATYIYAPKPDPEFIVVEDGHFQLAGKRWRAHGINYMPSSGISVEDRSFFEFWLGAPSYEPEVIQRDLDHMKDLGYNAVSIFIDHQSLHSQNLLDLLRRLDLLDMKANLSLRPGTPMDFQWDKMKEIIEYYRLRDNDAVFAYDLAWEPEFGKYDQRRRWDHDWLDWIVERYGTVEHAEELWACAVPRDEANRITNPSSQQIETDGPWRAMVAAYRRFCDTLLYRKYGAARRLVRSIDPNHLVSFRMSNAGNPTHRWEGRMPYDFPYLAGAVDFLGPEGYGRIGDWEQVKLAWFETAYARWAAPHLPVVWAEMGVSAWNRSLCRCAPAELAFQAEFYKHFYRMMTASGADGVFSWWYPGGFRYGETSDYGVINPDGTDRPVTRVIRDAGPVFLQAPDPDGAANEIEFDRDAHADGIVGVYESVADEFWSAIEDGKVPYLTTAGTGTTSIDCPLTPVGNTPGRGRFPLKYLDAVFDRVEVRDAQGRWVAVEKGGRVEVDGTESVRARLTVTNLGEATWVARKESKAEQAGAVRLSGGVPPLPLRLDVPRFKTAAYENIRLSGRPVAQPKKIVLQLEARDRAPFGERFEFTLVPARQKR